VLEEIDDQREKRTAATTKNAAAGSIPERLDPRIEFWLDELGRASETLKPASGPKAGDEVVAYIFGAERHASHGRLPVPFEVIVARRLASGKLSRVRDCPGESLANASAAVR
jgi:hypothetical protein